MRLDICVCSTFFLFFMSFLLGEWRKKWQVDRRLIKKNGSLDMIHHCRWIRITQLAHHVMLFVPIGCTFGDGLFNMDSVRRGSQMVLESWLVMERGKWMKGSKPMKESKPEQSIKPTYMATIVRHLNRDWWSGLN